MIDIKIPGHKKLRIEHLVLDYNGTIACDGKILPGVKTAVKRLARKLDIHVVTADTFGTAASSLKGLPCKLTILPFRNQDKAKLDYTKKLGAKSVACIGNGRNDRLMLEAAALGIAVVLEEGASMMTLKKADAVCTSIMSALGLLLHPKRLAATLRS